MSYFSIILINNSVYKISVIVLIYIILYQWLKLKYVNLGLGVYGSGFRVCGLGVYGLWLFEQNINIDSLKKNLKHLLYILWYG